MRLHWRLGLAGFCVLAVGCEARVRRVSEAVLFIEGRGGAPNQLVINTAHGPIVADARLNPLVTDDVLASVRKHSGWQDAAYLINTSALPYRWLTNYCFKRAEIVASERTLELMLQEAPAFMEALEERQPRPAWADEARLVFPTMTFRGRLVLRTPDCNVFVLELPAGVMPGNSVVWAPHLGVLYAGDLVTAGYAPALEYADAGDWLLALDELARLPVKILAPGFGPLSDGSLIERQAQCLRALIEKPAEDGIPGACRALWDTDPELPEKIGRLGSRR